MKGSAIGQGSEEKAVAGDKRVYRSLDAWRGIACLAVVLFHAQAALKDKFPQAAGFPLYAPLTFGYLGVQLFFLISGYCIAQSASANLAGGRPVPAFVSARLRRIFPAYWLSLPLFAALSLLASWLLAHGIVHTSALGSLHLLKQSPLFFLATGTLTQIAVHQSMLATVYWTLNYEIAFYAVTVLLLVACHRMGDRRRLQRSLNLLTAGSLCLMLVLRKDIGFPFDLWPQFGLGAALWDLVNHPEETSAKRWMLLLTALTVLLIARCDIPLGVALVSSRLSFTVCLAAALGLMVLHPFDRQLSQSRFVKGLSALGLISYSVYLVHTALIAPLCQSARAVHFPVAAHPLLLLLAATAGVSGGWVFHTLCERPFLRKAQRSTASMIPPLSPKTEPARAT